MKARLLLGAAVTIGALSSFPAAEVAAEPDMRLIGYVRTDAVFNANDSVSHPKGTSIPTARFGVKGRMQANLSYVFDFEFGNGASGKINDAFLTYTASDKLSVRLGQGRDQTSFEFLSTIKHRAFPDRAFNASLVPARRLGLTTFYVGENYAATFSVTGEGAEKKRTADEGYAVSGRLSYAPVLEGLNVLHVGVAAAWQKADDQQRSVSYGAKHETSVTPFKSISTGEILDVDSSLVTNVDAFAQTGPLWIMGEYTRSKVDRLSGQEDLTFDAWYAQAGWILTGESRSYSPRHGVGGMKPASDLAEGGPGALELAVRYDTLDLNDGVIRGGKIDRYSVSLNWYPVNHVQLRASYQASSASASTLLPKDKPQAVVLRAVWMF